jgi:hypothetical protein
VARRSNTKCLRSRHPASNARRVVAKVAVLSSVSGRLPDKSILGLRAIAFWWTSVTRVAAKGDFAKGALAERRYRSTVHPSAPSFIHEEPSKSQYTLSPI